MPPYPPLFPHGPPAWPLVDDDIRSVLNAMAHDGSWGRYEGIHGERLVAALQEQMQLPYVWPCSSGTVAVEIALRGLALRPGDEVVMAAYDFPGNFRALEAVEARPVLVDIDPDSWCLDVEHVEAAVGPATRAVLVSHLHGGLAPARRLRELTDRRGLWLVEDVCQSPGAVVDGRRAGSWGDVSVLSFGGSKLLSAGRGGAVLTARPDVFQRVKVFSERGNHAFPLSELQAAVLLPQVLKLAARNSVRRERAGQLLDALQSLDALRPLRDWRSDAGQEPAFYKLAWRESFERPATRERFIAAAHAAGIAIDAGFRGFAGRSERRCRKVGSLAHARAAADHTLLLHHPILLESAATIDRLATAIRRIVEELNASPE